MKLENPKAVASEQVVEAAGQDLKAWLREPKNRQIIPSKFEAVGYVPVRNYDAKNGFWKVCDRRQVIYAKAELALSERMAAARPWSTIRLLAYLAVRLFSSRFPRRRRK